MTDSPDTSPLAENEGAPPTAGPDTPETRLATGSALDLAARIVGVGTSFLIGVLVARMFGVEGKGALAVVMQVPGILVVALDLGITTATLYYVSRGELRPGTAAANAAIVAVLLGMLGAPVIFLLLSGPVAVVHNVPLAATFFAMGILPLGLLGGWLGAISVGLSDLAVPLKAAIASSITTLVGLAALVLTGHGTLTSVVGASVAGSVVGIVALWLGLRRWLRPLQPELSAARSSARFSAKAYLSNMAGVMHERQDVLLLGWLAGAGAVGLYSVGVSFAELTWYIPSALSAAILAKGSRRSDLSATDYTTRTARIAILFMIATIIVSLIAVPFVIPFVYGRAFAPAALAFFALLPGVLADGVTRILWSYQTTRGRLMWRFAIGTLALNAVAIVILVPRFGAVGAGLASSVSYSVLAALVVRRFCRDTGASAAEVLVPQESDFEVVWRTVKRLVRRGPA